jgi:molybdopterin molybdotransferase
VRPLLSVDEAARKVLERARPLPAETVTLADAAGRVLARDALAVVDLPPFASSAMDGYALRAASVPGPLRVVGSVAAGRPADGVVGAGEAMTIATGGAVPPGADAVVPIELARVGGGAVEVPSDVTVGANIRPAAGDVRAGAVAVGAGLRLTPARIAALAAAGVASADVHRRPRAVVVATGTELRAPGDELAPGEIYESNGIMLESALEVTGAVASDRVVVADDPDEHRAVLERALEADLVVTSGGVSVGPHDLVRATLGSLEVEEVFWGVAMRPGKPIAFGVRAGTLVFGLPGNPVSSLVGFMLFVAPAVRALQGDSDPHPHFLPGVLGAPARRNPGRDDYLRAQARWGSGEVVLEPVRGQESHMIVRGAAADALVLVPRGEGELPSGSPVRFLLL